MVESKAIGKQEMPLATRARYLSRQIRPTSATS